MKILLTGQGGQVGSELMPSLRGLGEVVSFPRAEFDLTDLDQVRDVIRAVKPALIVNAAGHTAVAKAELEAPLAMLLNAEAPAVMAQEAQRLGAAIVHYSTDYVFDGEQTPPYDETAPTNPLNVYGKSKAAGEQAIARHCEVHWILRTSWVYSASGNNFMKTVVRLAQTQSQLTMIADQIGAPTWAKTISRITRELLTGSEKSTDPAEILKRLRATAGIYHLTAAGETSWYDYAILIVDHLRARGVPVQIADNSAIKPVSTSASDLPQRPKNSRLALGKLESTFGVRMPHWRDDAVRCLDDIIAQSAPIPSGVH